MPQYNPSKVRKVDKLINCLNNRHYSRLPENNEHYYNQTNTPELTATFKTNGLTVYFGPGMDGGGTTFGLQILPMIQQLYPNRVFNHCYEWCSGPGFIGFDLLSHGVCNELWLGDIFKPSLDAVDKTIEHLPEQYKNRVHPVHIKDGSEIPETTKFDLIVSNPPHWNSANDILISRMQFNNRCAGDPNWVVHRGFFENIKKNLADDGVILLQEQSYASGPETFKSMIDQAGLEIVGCWWNSQWIDYYYLEIKHQGK